MCWATHAVRSISRSSLAATADEARRRAASRAATLSARARWRVSLCGNPFLSPILRNVCYESHAGSSRFECVLCLWTYLAPEHIFLN
jgi:hypothetical protein